MIDTADIKRIVTDYTHGSEHPDLVVYRRDFDTKFDFDRWFTGIQNTCGLGNFAGKRILEVGCGFGWDAVGISLAGDNHVVATDILPSMIAGTDECLETMRRKGQPLDVEAMQGDICSLDFPDRSFDGIYSSEAVEHVHDLDAMFRRCFQLLKPGGRMVIINDSNRFNSEFREDTFKMWKERDESWEHAKWLKAEIRPVEHKDARPYAAMREDIVREAQPPLGDDDVAKVVAATAGLIRRDIAEATREFMASGVLPTRPTYSWCRNPETGEYAERLLDPFEMVDTIRKQGFRNVRLRHAFTRFPHRLLNGVRFKALSKYLFDKRGQFLIVADRP